MSDFWTEGTKAIAAAVSGIGGWSIAARLWRQMDRVKQARSEGDARVTEAEAGGQVDAIARFERLATLAEQRADRAEQRELLAVQRADRAEQIARDADDRAEESERRAVRAESEVTELKKRIERLESMVGQRRVTDAKD